HGIDWSPRRNSPTRARSAGLITAFIWIGPPGSRSAWGLGFKPIWSGWQPSTGFTGCVACFHPGGQPCGGAALPGRGVSTRLSGTQRSAGFRGGVAGFQPEGQPGGGAAPCRVGGARLEGWQRRMGFTPGATGSQPAGQPGGGAAVPGARVAVMLSGRQRSAELSSGGTGFQPVGQPVGGAARCGAAVRVCADAADAASARPTAKVARAVPDTAARRRGAAVPREVVVTVMGVSPEEGNGLEAASAVAGGSVGQSYPAGRSRHAAAMAVWSRSWKAAHGQT